MARATEDKTSGQKYVVKQPFKMTIASTSDKRHTVDSIRELTEEEYRKVPTGYLEPAEGALVKKQVLTAERVTLTKFQDAAAKAEEAHEAAVQAQKENARKDAAKVKEARFRADLAQADLEKVQGDYDQHVEDLGGDDEADDDGDGDVEPP